MRPTKQASKSQKRMNRRHFLKLAATAGLVAQMNGFSQTTAAIRGSAKKGIGLSTRDEHWRNKLDSLRAQWMYSWGSRKPVGIPAGVEFVPMVWGYRDAPRLKNELAICQQSGGPAVLAFNEPDGKDQANLSVETALAAWPQFMTASVKLGSPACVQPDGEWMRNFMERADKLKYRVDFVCIHSYAGPNTGALVKRLTKVHEMFGRPLWITEFGVGDWNAKTLKENQHSRESVLAFMKECLPALDELSFLERYAWFASDATSPQLGTSALVNPDQTLTPLGQFYAAH
jgi:hypothetical protein